MLRVRHGECPQDGAQRALVSVEQVSDRLAQHVMDANLPLIVGKAESGCGRTVEHEFEPALESLGVAGIAAVPVAGAAGPIGAIMVACCPGRDPLGVSNLETLKSVAALITAHLAKRSQGARSDRRIPRARPGVENIVSDDLAQAVELSPFASCLVTLEGRFMRVSAPLARLLGRSPEGMLGLSAIDVTHHEDRDRMVAMMGLMRAGAVRNPKFEKRCLHASGETVRALLSGALIRDASGEPLCFLFGVEAPKDSEQKAGEEQRGELQQALDNATGGIALLDRDGRYVRVNDAYARMLGYECRELLRTSWRQTVAPSCLAAMEAAYAEMLETGRACAETTGVRRDGSRVEKKLELVLHRGQDGSIRGHYCFAWDITERKDADRRQATLLALTRLALARTDLRLVLEESVSAVSSALWISHTAVFHAQAQRDVLLLQAGHGWPSKLIGTAIAAMGADTHVGYAYAAAEPVVFDDLRTEPRLGGCRLLRDHGVTSGAAVQIGDPAAPVGVLGVYSEEARVFSADEVVFLEMVAAVIASAVDREHAEEEIRHQALHDRVTGLPNRTHFRSRLGHAADARPNAPAAPLAVLLIGLTGVRQAKRLLGHESADALVAECAGRVGSVLRASDVLGRIDEGTLGVILPRTARRRALEVARKIIGSLADPIVLGGHEHSLGAALGVVTTDGGWRDPDQLLDEADAARQRAVAAGSGRYELFDSERHRDLMLSLQLEKDLASAVTDDQLELHYQPIFDLSDRSVYGVEALLRWRHPTRGLLAPGDFIQIAEQSGLIVPIGGWVLEQAARQLARWNAEHPGLALLRMHVNVAAAQFEEGGLVETVVRVIEETGIEASQLALELTETTLMVEVESTDRALAGLTRLGVMLVLDDFGTGYSSLGYLKRLPIHTVKIDRSFIAGVAANRQDRAIVAAVLGMADASGLGVVAEGVETEKQAEALIGLHCAYAQGFLLSRPLPVDEADALLAARKAGRG